MQRVGVFLAGMFFLLAVPGHLEAREKDYGLAELFRLAAAAEKIKVAKEQVSIAEFGRGKAKAALLPRLSGSAGVVRFTEKKLVGAAVVQPESAASWGARLDQTISLGGRELANLSLADENIAKSRLDQELIKEEYLLQTAFSYFEALKANKSLEIAGTNLERLGKHREATVKRVKLGELTRTALLRAEGELSGAQADFVRAKNGLEMARNQLVRLVNLEGDFQLREPEFLLKEVVPLEEAKAETLSRRIEIKSLEQQRKIAEQQVRLAQAAYWPTVNLQVSYSGLDQNPAAATTNREAVSAGASLTYPLFDGGSRRAEVAEARARARQIDLSIKDVKRAITAELESVYLELVTQRGILDFNQNQLTFARDNFQAISRQFEVGLANSIDVMDANALLVSAERKLMETRYNYLYYFLRLKKVMGMPLDGR